MLPGVLFGKRRRSAAEEVRAGLGHDVLVIDERANCYGVESEGVTQIRGNGCLALGRDTLLFRMWIPRKEIAIPRQRITAVERARSHLGKTQGRELLRVRFTTPEGTEDSVAWLVRDLPAWEAALSS